MLNENFLVRSIHLFIYFIFPRYVLDEYCTSRRSVLVRAFIDALTLGGVGGTPKPIEMHAHDPKRYVGDMLAWLHQTIPGERENLLILLKGCDKTGGLFCFDNPLSLLKDCDKTGGYFLMINDSAC